ncbi:ParB/RepB/Spo0J family partition protein [Bradyrhizobium sp. LjRoot220]|uniref:ParB/RepB/Spo0J family partition protein n=1 Tax=Bradyrhizobium sp. LjRoot220 TaxID=3342284 RepID=UPI003ECF3BCD
MDLQHIPLSNLKIANVNVRHGRKPPDVSDILPSIRARGVLQPLLVRPNGEGFEIVAGRRRYFAASRVAEEQGVAATEVLLPCAVTEPGDDAGAVEASLIENVARAPMNELEEFEAFAKLLKQGRGVADIALTFGVTELYVKQRFALATLHSRIKDAYRDGDIRPEDLQLLASATRRQQKEWIAAFEQESDPENEEAEGAPRGYQLKQWLFGVEQIATGAALFAIEDYKGEVITDLFGDVSCFADRDAFWALQNVAIAGLRDELVSKGWKVSVLEKGQRFQTWQHVETPKEDGGSAFIEIRDTGEVEVHEGYLARDERPRRNGGNAEGEGEEAADKAAKPELTKAAENYLALHRHAIVRAELLARPGVALRLAVAHMVAGSPLWSVKPDPQRAYKEEIAASITASKAQTAFEAARNAILQLLDMEASYQGTVTRGNGDPHWGATVFARLLALPDEAVLKVLTVVMAETLAAGSALVEAAGVVVKPDVVRWWTADDTFLDLVRDRVAVNAMLGEVAGKAVADANVSETAKVQRKIVHDCLTGEGRERTEGWVPRYMAFPPRHYDPNKTLQIATDWEAIKPLFTSD